MTRPPAILVAIPRAVHDAGGVGTWATRLLTSLASRGVRAGLVLHADAPPRPATSSHLFNTFTLPPLGDDPAVHLPDYDQAADVVAGDAPLVVMPSLLGDCYGLAVALAERRPRTRVVGVVHNDIPYDYHLQRHYEPAISTFVGVSTHLASTLAGMLPHRAADIRAIPHGVAVPPLPPRGSVGGRPLRLVYAGRMDHAQKRVGAFPHLSRALTSRGIRHELVLAGDGPARADLSRQVRDIAAVTVLGPQPPDHVLALFASADGAVLASRHEGLSVSVIEAMSRGCVPVITRTASGAAELIEHGVSGWLVEAPPDLEDEAVGERLADAVAMAAPRLEEMSRAAHARASAMFSIDLHADAYERVLAQAARQCPRPWPADRPWAFSAPEGAPSGSLPAGAPGRLRDLLASLEGRAVVIHGTGRHTRQLRAVLLEAPCSIVAFADDDPATHGTELWGRPVLAPDAAARTGATDVVVSSYINEAAIWSRRGVYERSGLRVHRLYAGQPRPAP